MSFNQPTQAQRLRRGLFASVGIVLFGYFLMKATVPTEEQLYQKLSPAQREQVDKERAKNREKNARFMAFLKEQAESDEPVLEFDRNRKL
ncbi:10671_t:CDS:2 [Ambispora gerdemannii]|uniref:Cytochrome b mRNA-processing protein 4 n=1 Tax=Ambispora gerdemannii TaxID=144530 RepID=A0A9N9BYM0_9GLOM|nr:10671_t:CDS:2 [Ambispora gerdemannii]